MNMHNARAASGLDTLKTILGIPVVAIRWNDAIVLLNRLIAERRFTKVSFLNAHNANIAHTDPVFAEALDDFLILPDGIGVDLAAKLLYGAPFPDNLNGTDFVPAFLQASTTPLTVGLLGATRVNAEAASVKLAALAVQHRFVVIHDGYFLLRRNRKSSTGSPRCGRTCFWSPWACHARNCGSHAISTRATARCRSPSARCSTS